MICVNDEQRRRTIATVNKQVDDSMNKSMNWNTNILMVYCWVGRQQQWPCAVVLSLKLVITTVKRAACVGRATAADYATHYGPGIHTRNTVRDRPGTSPKTAWFHTVNIEHGTVSIVCRAGYFGHRIVPTPRHHQRAAMASQHLTAPHLNKGAEPAPL